MKTVKKLLVWGAFIAMAFVVAGCEEEEGHFDSVVDVEETSSEGLGDGSGESTGGVHVVKNSVGDAVSDLFFGGEEDTSEAAPDTEEAESTVSDEPVIGSTEEPIAESPSSGSDEVDASVSTPISEPVAPTEGSETEKATVKETEKAAVKETEKAAVKETEKAAVKETEKAEPIQQDVSSEEPVKEAQPQEETSQAVVEEASVDKDITVLIINEAKTRFGMVAILDPHTKEQVLIGALDNEEMYVLEMAWPSKEKHLRIAVYDEAGNMVKEDSIDFKGISVGSVITLNGEGSLSDISSEIE